MRRLSFFLLFAASFACAYRITDRGRPRDAYYAVCDLVSRHFYKDTPQVRNWIARCRSFANRLPSRASSDEILELLQAQMDGLGVSHFRVYAPAEDRKLWRGEAVHTGVRARYVDGHLLVYEVIPGSAAARAGITPGDELLALPGVAEVSVEGASWRSGEYTLSRAGRVRRVMIRPTDVVIEGGPRVKDLDGGVSLLSIPSFRGEFYDRDALAGLTRRLASRRALILDLRENSGGNFVAMLRLLSFFNCGGRTIGHLRQARNADGGTGALVNDLDDGVQIRQLMHARELALITPVGYGCFSGPAITLVGPGTASVAEIFADAMANRERSSVWGWATAGDVVLAIWHPLPALGRDFSVAIPQASFFNAREKELEGSGVRPSRELVYDLGLERRGEDSWVSAAARALR